MILGRGWSDEGVTSRPTGAQRERISMNLQLRLQLQRTQRWPGITSAPSARLPSLSANMSSRHMRSRGHSAPAPTAPLSSHTATAAIAHTSVSIVETSLPEGMSSLHLPPPAPLISITPTSPLCSSPQAISSQARQQMPSQRETSALLSPLAARALFY